MRVSLGRRALLLAPVLLALPALPATAADARPAPALSGAPGSALAGVVAAPSPASLARLRDALVRSAAGRPGLSLRVAEGTAAPAESAPERAYLGDLGDVDGDGRRDVVEERERTTVVRSGRTGAVLLRRTDESLLPAPAGAGAVRLVSLRFAYTETADGYATTVRLQGLDRAGRTRWTSTSTGSVRQAGVEDAGVVLLDGVLAQLAPTTDASGRPALLLGALSGTASAAGAATRLQLQTLSLADGRLTARETLSGAGTGFPVAVPADELGRGCVLGVQPLAAASLVQLSCGGSSPVWQQPVDLVAPYPALAGDFDGDRRPDVSLTTFGFEDPQPGETGRGTQVLAGTDGSALARGPLDGLVPMGVDVSGDRQPDFLRPVFASGLGLQGVTLAGRRLYQRTVDLEGSGSISLSLGPDVTGDGTADGFLLAAPQQGTGLAVVVDGRRGQRTVVPGGDGLLLPGLRGRGGDVLVQDVAAGHARLAVHAGDDGRRLARVTVPGPAGTVAHGSALAVDADGDGRRDLVTATRTGDRRLTTATTPAGRVLWQQSVRAPALRPEAGGVVLG